jgi:hypothetical protein
MSPLVWAHEKTPLANFIIYCNTFGYTIHKKMRFYHNNYDISQKCKVKIVPFAGITAVVYKLSHKVTVVKVA